MDVATRRQHCSTRIMVAIHRCDVEWGESAVTARVGDGACGQEDAAHLMVTLRSRKMKGSEGAVCACFDARARCQEGDAHLGESAQRGGERDVRPSSSVASTVAPAAKKMSQITRLPASTAI